MKRCNQCWKDKPLAEFQGVSGREITWCSDCRAKYRGGKYGERGSAPRRQLRVLAAEPRFIWAPRSGNKKLGGIPACIVSPETCPPSCGFYGRGCYAEFGVMGYHWRRTQDVGISWAELLERVRALPAGTLWRYAVAGDLPGHGDELDVSMLAQLVEANAGRRGFTFTHKPLRSESEQQSIAHANARGFTINLSADSLARAEELKALGIAPVAVVLPRSGEAPRGVLVCTAESKGLDCKRCQVCAVAARRSVVGFHAHGQMSATVSRIASTGVSS